MGATEYSCTRLTYRRVAVWSERVWQALQQKLRIRTTVAQSDGCGSDDVGDPPQVVSKRWLSFVNHKRTPHDLRAVDSSASNRDVDVTRHSRNAANRAIGEPTL